MQPAIINIFEKASRKAGKILTRDFGEIENLQIHSKSIGDFVTNADLKVEKNLLETLKYYYPNYTYISEEAGKIKGDENIIIIDPIDGTNNFVHNYPSFAVSIGVFFKSKPLVGVVYDIPNNEKFFASKDGGSFSNDSPISVSDKDHFSEGLYVTGFVPYDENYIDKNFRVLKNVNLNSHGVRRLGAASLDMCHVAKGIVEGFWEYNLQPWDTAAGNIIISEAGGTVSNENGNQYNFDKCIVASNKKVHKDFLKIIKES